MRAKLWERTAFRVVLFLLCAVFTAGAVCLASVGSAKFSDFNARQDNQIWFRASDAFRAKGFLESDTFRSYAQNSMSALSALNSLCNNAADGGEAGIDSGSAYEQAVEQEVRDVYENIRSNIIDSQQSLYDSPGEYDEGVGYSSPGGVHENVYPVTMDYNFANEEFYWHGGMWDGNGGAGLAFSMRQVLNDPTIVPEGQAIRNYDEPGVSEAFKALFPKQIEEIRLSIADARRSEYQYYINRLGAAYYYVGYGERWLSNVEVDSEGRPADMSKLTGQSAWAARENRTINSSPEGLFDKNDTWSELGRATAYISWPEEAITYYEGIFNTARSIIWVYFFSAAALLIAAVILLVWLIVFTGRKRPAYDGTRRLWAFDRIFAEIQVVALIALLALGVNAVSWLANGYNHGWIVENGLYFALFCIAGFALSAAVLWFLLSLIRIGKAGLFVKRSLIGLFATVPCKALGGAIKSGYDGRNPLAKSLILVILLWLLASFFAGICGITVSGRLSMGFLIAFILLLLTLAGALYITYKWAERYGRLRKGVEEIADGNLSYRIEITSDGRNEFDRLSAYVNELGSAQNTALQNELKNQRLKTDLISNVSHDLKTPLTSILTYTDLLKTEGLKGKNAEEYLQIIDEKGQRLRKLTEDLFDAAKASSGALNVRKEKVDVLALLEQEIAEMNGGFAETGLELVIEADGEHYYVEADSQLLWRVVDNLLRNVRKYAQPGTRVYIELKERLPARSSESSTGKDGKEQPGAAQAYKPLMTTLEIKNTSATKLNIPPEELMERFKRGDESRATEGSGLGLAIAKDLVRLQNGWFEIFIDGDLFKAVVMLPPYLAEE